MTRRLVCIHGHFYQPPRENPWIEEVEVQDSAAPFHDWNARIAAECYAPNAAARLKAPSGRIADIVNNYLHLSFNFGPTLLAWMERNAPGTYRQILEADAQSVRDRGHGNAIAQGYNHAILPLCSTRDLRTQVRWGLADFRHRFGRAAEGMWLPETGADLATLRALADEGLRFTVLSPYQAVRVRAPGGQWVDAREARFDPTRPYNVPLGDGRTLAVFFYDGPISRAVAFGEGLQSGDDLVRRIETGLDARRGHDEVLSLAVDGETFGHHKKGGDEVLAAALRKLEERGDVRLVNFAQALDECPPEWEAEIAEGSSWSCMHGVERWRSDCGCQGNGQPGWRQTWRGPLREALDFVRDELGALFEKRGAGLFADPWRAREDFIEVVLDPSRKNAAAFLARQARRLLDEQERVVASKLLEMQRQTLLMYTSCGWFFSELSGLETVQILQYAARALQLAREATGVDLEEEFRKRLGRAPSNVMGDGARIYDERVKPAVVALDGVAGHYAIASLVDGFQGGKDRLFCYELNTTLRRREDAGPATLALSRLEMRSLVTGERADLSICVLHFSGADFRCGLRPYQAAAHAELEVRLFEKLASHSLAQVVRELDHAFQGRDYTLRDLFLDERREVAAKLLDETMDRYENDYISIYETNRRLIEFLREIDSPVPRPLQVAADVALSQQAHKAAARLAAGALDLSSAKAQLLRLQRMAQRLGARIDLNLLRPAFDAAVRALVVRTASGKKEAAGQLAEVIALSGELRLPLDLWQAQNQLWEHLRSPGCALEPAIVSQLASALWLDEAGIAAGRARKARVAPRVAAEV